MQTAKRQASLTTSSKIMGKRRDPALLYSGKVIDVHPENSTVDVKLASGDTLRGVRILFTSAATQTGWRYLSYIKNVKSVKTPTGTDDVATLGHIQDVIAIVGYLDGNTQTPRIMGFDFPIDSQMHLKEDGLYTFRHESGVYEVITKEGHHETHYPDGSYIIYGPDSSPKDMTSINGNGQPWAPPTTSTPMTLTINLAGGVTISASNGVLSINGGTNEVARVNDAIQVTVNGTVYTGKITGGASNFKA